jgi:hypothetical protein
LRLEGFGAGVDRPGPEGGSEVNEEQDENNFPIFNPES